MVFSLASMILAIVLVSWITPYVADFLKENTDVYNDLTINCTNTIRQSMENSIGEATESIVKEDEPVSSGGIHLPEVWLESILEKTDNTMNQVLDKSGLYEVAGGYIAERILQGIAFFVSFVLVFIVLRLVVGLLDIVGKLPVIKGTNRFLGAITGLIQGFLLVWLLLFLVAVACTSRVGQMLTGYIRESAFLTWMYQHNGILYFLNYILGA